MKSRQGALAIRFRRPHYRQGCNQFQHLLNLLGILSVLNQFHDDQAGHNRKFSQGSKPRHCGSMATLNVDQYISIQ